MALMIYFRDLLIPCYLFELQLPRDLSDYNREITCLRDAKLDKRCFVKIKKCWEIVRNLSLICLFV